MHSEQTCKHCERAVPGDQIITLWDGHAYCQRCVEIASPELARYARSHEKLEETAFFERGALWRSALRMELIIALLFGALSCTYGYSIFGPIGIAYGLAMSFVICGLQAASQLPLFVRISRWKMPTVIVHDGNIECFRGRRKAHWVQSMPLENVSWRLGKSRQDSGLRHTIVPRQEVVILTVPWKAGRRLSVSDRYACGWTDEKRRIWIAFLTLANVPRSS